MDRVREMGEVMMTFRFLLDRFKKHGPLFGPPNSNVHFSDGFTNSGLIMRWEKDVDLKVISTYMTVEVTRVGKVILKR